MTDSAQEGDYLGYGVYADTLWERIKRALDKDKAAGSIPATFKRLVP